MKATSIEQIREHLARGGRVTSYRGDVALCIDADGKIRYESPAGFTWRATFNKGDWELLPLDENFSDQTFCEQCKYKSVSGDFCPKCRRLWAWLRGELKEETPKPIQRPARVKPRTDEEWTALAKQKLPSVEELRQIAKDNPPPQAWYDEDSDDDSQLKPCPFCGGVAESMTYCGNDTIFCETCPAMMGGEESRATREELAAAWNRRGENIPGVPASSLPLVTDDPSESYDENALPRYLLLRSKVLFGQPWSIEEQLEVWELLTTERIEHGRRCEKCGGLGKVPWYGHAMAIDGPIMRPCQKCEDSCGYTVRPTWMGER